MLLRHEALKIASNSKAYNKNMEHFFNRRRMPTVPQEEDMRRRRAKEK